VPIPPDIAHHRAVIASNARWSRPGARERQSATQSEARRRLYESRVDPDGILDPAERARLADNALRADMARLALASVKARRHRAAQPGPDDPPRAA
jgi:hypothetical protein